MDQQKLIKQELDSKAECYGESTEIIKEEVPIEVIPSLCPNRYIIPSNDKLYQCNACEKLFAQKRYLIRHQKIHDQDKQYQCDLCTKSFIQKGNLVRHRQIHNQENHYQGAISDNNFTKQTDNL